MKRRKLFVVAGLVASVCWAGGGKYKIAEGEAFAEFFSEGTSDSSATTGRNIQTWTSADAGCKPNRRGERLGSDIHTGTHAKTEPVKIAAGEEFLFTISYMEGRFNGTRQCGVTGIFTPAAGRRYKGKIIGINDVERCELGVYDVTDGSEQQVTFSMPEKSCLFTMKGQMPNGTPLWTVVKVNTLP
jgi:hypothetical protein